ncbi:putative chemoreceptor glutamine deamidase CheD [Frankliniella fusca]|uniref:Chemoreceptor glutamine deamidase CheD n=1 Tax=Frankliniella fusca TaxID=407009 RepID=A0AAE1H2R4_9NEOP|nr:putative chemoreceptor glutamine deamidase CheD [Frankliniella fusca]
METLSWIEMTKRKRHFRSKSTVLPLLLLLAGKEQSIHEIVQQMFIQNNETLKKFSETQLENVVRKCLVILFAIVVLRINGEYL